MIRMVAGLVFVADIKGIRWGLNRSLAIGQRVVQNKISEKTPCLHLFKTESRPSSGPLAQLEERLNGIEEVSGSIPLGSTTSEE